MNGISRFHGPNAGYVLELYERYLEDPESVDPASRSIFERWKPEATNGAATAATVAGPAVAVDKIVGAAKLAQSIRQFGHRAARLDPLGTDPPGDPALDPATHGLDQADLAALPASVVGGPVAAQTSNAAEAIERLRQIYGGTIGYDYEFIQSAEQRNWILNAIETGRYHQPLSAEEKKRLLQRLTEVETFERFLHRAFVGQKRFSIEGTDMMVPMLDEIIGDAAANGSEEVIIGMAHRGRLNVLTHILGKTYEQNIRQFLGAQGQNGTAPSEDGTSGWTGDVKYHLGARRTSGEINAKITLASNPSHLEFVNPVIEGMARAAQEDRTQPGLPQQDVKRCLPIAIHGDAAFPGEGVVAETLNLSRLPGYQTGGTVHIIANNQLGYTTEPEAGRSTYYASDVARGFEIPVIHVNADDPEACLVAARIAFAYRQEFHQDFLIDLIGYRRWGHNEGDEPAFTQPRLYAKISAHPTVREIWAQTLDREGIVPKQESDAMVQSALDALQELRSKVASGDADGSSTTHEEERNLPPQRVDGIETGVQYDTLRELNAQIHALPEDFSPNPKLGRNMQRRQQTGEEGGMLDWAHAETLALAAILADGTPIRMTGQDTERGTFSQRHLVFHCVETGRRAIPLATMPAAQASFALYNSPLSETGAMGFEYGYSIHAPEALVIWEAQFGDFANAAQVIIDQFIVSAQAKWREHPSLVLLLPHGYEGQGPEHSSGRLERFLQLAADDNIRVANCTTSAQYFHLLRRQAALLQSDPRPLVVMTPKGLLRHPKAASPLEELANGQFSPVLDDPATSERREAVGRAILCTGKVYVDLITAQETENREHVSLIRVEELYPFPEERIRQVLGTYPNLQEVVWLQEEPKNMGAWRYMEPRLRQIAGDKLDLRYIGRPERASPATGHAEVHAAEQARIVENAFLGVPVPEMKAYGVKNAD